MNKKIKIYTYKTFGVIFIAVVTPIAIVGAIILSILLPNWIVITIPFMCCMLFAYIGMIVTGELTPIYLSEKGLKYRKQSISWEDIRVTAIPLRRSVRYSYYLVFDTEYLYGKEAIKQCRKGFCVYVTKKSLNLILNYYKAKLLVLDARLEKEVLPCATNSINEIINNFNNQF